MTVTSHQGAMPPLTTLMAQEAAEAPQVVAHQLDANRETCVALAEHLRADPPAFVVTCARGSSDHAATKSFIASMSALLQLAAYWSEKTHLLNALTSLPDQLSASSKLDWSAAEIMHGPLALVGRGFPMLVFSQQDATRDGIRRLTKTLKDIGASVWVAEAGTPFPDRLPILRDVHPACAPLLMIQSLYALANRVALARGLNPDRPRHLRKITGTR